MPTLGNAAGVMRTDERLVNKLYTPIMCVFNQSLDPGTPMFRPSLNRLQTQRLLSMNTGMPSHTMRGTGSTCRELVLGGNQ